MFNIRIGLTKVLHKLKFLNYQPTGRYISLGEVEPTDDNSKHNMSICMYVCMFMYIYIYNNNNNNKQHRKEDVGTAERAGINPLNTELNPICQ